MTVASAQPDMLREVKKKKNKYYSKVKTTSRKNGLWTQPCVSYYKCISFRKMQLYLSTEI